MRADRLAAAVMLVATSGLALPARAADPAIAFEGAWAAPAAKGADTSLSVSAENAAAEDAIIRVRCEVANFTELRTVDRGEGFPSARTVKAIPIAANGRTVLSTEGFSIRLLQLTRPLAPGDTFDCALRLRGGAQQTVTATVRDANAE